MAFHDSQLGNRESARLEQAQQPPHCLTRVPAIHRVQPEGPIVFCSSRGYFPLKKTESPIGPGWGICLLEEQQCFLQRNPDAPGHWQ